MKSVGVLKRGNTLSAKYYREPIPMERRGDKHQDFKAANPKRRLEYGLDLVKAMSNKGLTPQGKLALMVELYDDLLEHSEMARLWRLAADYREEREPHGADSEAGTPSPY